MPVLLSGSPREPSSDDCILCTRSGERIPVATDEQLASRSSYKTVEHWNNFYLKKFSMGIKVRSAPRYPYNCVGMVFGSRRVWIDDDHIPQILSEDDFRKIERQDADIGDVIVYIRNQTPVHIGIIYRKELEFDNSTPRFWVLSKWGELAEFEHFEDIVPEVFGEQREFYTERIPM